MVATTAQCLLPQFPSFSTEHAEEQEDEESLQGCENSKQDLECEANFLDSDGESSKQPGQAKEEHHSCYADHESDEGLDV